MQVRKHENEFVVLFYKCNTKKSLQSNTNIISNFNYNRTVVLAYIILNIYTVMYINVPFYVAKSGGLQNN